ncbi:hypothetical protein LI210_21675 [Parabacteroides distasonis]|uniref:Uncharacterized protein n=1 Tax=Parabacteroides distasonis TaxID=823 RepID=A0AAP2VML0_PARDI|nr:hypothetical protein [Parabacteroides distasonis]MBV4300380.1 hypothetical protein [Parabacteroides distasonis]MBV4307619.1 hypothetical protein [Parabacteroides distasonis]MBV4395598.1 hypothetical protein [Parabacteroides distasonis]MCB6378879.1 hypothetical protein [Parabacteroides distasonis]MCB6520396.1 hypothetical protein [Parabacteroides distasonis]
MTFVLFCLLQMRRDKYMLHPPQGLEDEYHDTTSMNFPLRDNSNSYLTLQVQRDTAWTIIQSV